MEPYSQTVASFARGLDLSRVPQEVIDKAKLVFLDTLGIALASSTMDFGGMVLNLAKKLGGPAESLELTHRAASRTAFARGALAAAKWIVGRPAGEYRMAAVLNLPLS